MTKTQTDNYIKKLLKAPEIDNNTDIKKYRQELKMRGIAPKPPEIKITEGANINNLPPKLKAIFERAKYDQQFVNELTSILAQAVQKLQKHAINQETFCDYFIYPESVEKKLLKLYGLSEQEIKSEFEKIGFHPAHRTFNNPYYQVLLLAYGIGLYLNDPKLRILSLILITARIWNGRISNSFKYGCNKDTARYVMNYLLQNNSVFKQYKTPFNFLVNYFVISVDKNFAPYVRQDLAHEINGLRKILTTIQPRLQQLFVNTLAKWYYYAHKNGLKETSTDAYGKTYQNDKEMVETKETIKNTIEQLLDIFNKNLILNKDILLQADAKQLLKNKFALSDKAIQKLNDWFNDEENHDDLKLLAEFLLQGIQPKTQEDFCTKDINALTTEIGNAKKNEYFLRIKNYRKQLFERIFGIELKEPLNQTQYRWLNIISYALVIFIKKLICKKI